MPTTFSDSRPSLNWPASPSLAAAAAAAAATSSSPTTDIPQSTIFRQAFLKNANMLPLFGSSDTYHHPYPTGKWRLPVPKESPIPQLETHFQENALSARNTCSVPEGEDQRTDGGTSVSVSVIGGDSFSSDGGRNVPEVTCRLKLSDANGGGVSPWLDSASWLKVRHAGKRLKKYQAKEEKLRHSTESKQKMLGALCVRRNLLMSEMVNTMQKVKDSRQRLDKQRTANKALMKRIDHLTSLDTKDSGGESRAEATSAGGQLETVCSDRNNSSGQNTLCSENEKFVFFGSDSDSDSDLECLERCFES